MDEKTRKKIRQTFKETGKIRKTARLVRVSRNAVRRELRKTQENTVPASRPKRPGKLDPIKPRLSIWHAKKIFQRFGYWKR